MTRKFWGIIMVLSLLITCGAAYFWLEKMNQTEMAGMVTDAEAGKADNVTFEKPAEPSAAEEKPTQTAPEPAAASAPTRNILFRFPRASAKSVYIIGDFNDWRREPMKKENNGWQITLPLAPGTYQYMFVVEEKRVKDPNNKNSADGKSLINVKPLSTQK